MANQRRSVEKEAYWRGQLELQSTSGLSIRRWCRESGVSEPTFYVWRRELRKRDHFTDQAQAANLSRPPPAVDERSFLDRIIVGA